MKRFFLILTLLTALAGVAHAQQAKAYELVKFTAHQKGLTFKLDYTDGYIEASTISFRQDNKTFLFRPDSGTLAEDSTLRFTTERDSSQVIILKHVDETVIAPRRFTAIYRSKDGTVTLLFSQKQ